MRVAASNVDQVVNPIHSVFRVNWTVDSRLTEAIPTINPPSGKVQQMDHGAAMAKTANLRTTSITPSFGEGLGALRDLIAWIGWLSRRGGGVGGCFRFPDIGCEPCRSKLTPLAGTTFRDNGTG
jgi:hypothetical protein